MVSGVLNTDLIQGKSMVEKTKTQLLDERDGLRSDLRDMTTAYQESEKRRKNAESALSEAQSRIGEDTSRIQDLTSQTEKMKVWLYAGRMCWFCDCRTFSCRMN